MNIYIAIGINVRNRSIHLNYEKSIENFREMYTLEKDLFPFNILILLFSISFSVSNYYSFVVPLSFVPEDYSNLLFRMSNSHKCLLLDINSHVNSLVNQNLKYALFTCMYLKSHRQDASFYSRILLLFQSLISSSISIFSLCVTFSFLVD